MWGDCNAVTNKRCCIGRVVLWEVKSVYGGGIGRKERGSKLGCLPRWSQLIGKGGRERRGGGEGGGQGGFKKEFKEISRERKSCLVLVS